MQDRMRNNRARAALALLVAAVMILAGCSGGAGGAAGGAPQAVERYLKALVERDENALIAASCAAFEEQARTEFDSFAAVKLNLQDVACQESGKDGAATLVTCSGQIIANYGAEDLQIDVADRTYLTVEEGGEWRMCGYR